VTGRAVAVDAATAAAVAAGNFTIVAGATDGTGDSGGMVDGSTLSSGTSSSVSRPHSNESAPRGMACGLAALISLVLVLASCL
jgi:hypothetical protein